MKREALEKSIDAALGWRKKELISLRNNAACASNIEQVTLIRCLIFLSYAHWEGFVRRSATLYFEYIFAQDHKYAELSDNMVAAAISRRASSPTTKVSYYGETAQFLRYGQNDVAEVKTPHDIQDIGMFGSERLRSILYCLALDETPFELKFNWLDRTLLAERNKVAHGEFLAVTQQNTASYFDLCDQSLELIELFRQQIVVAASDRNYLRRPTLPIVGERL